MSLSRTTLTRRIEQIDELLANELKEKQILLYFIH